MNRRYVLIFGVLMSGCGGVPVHDYTTTPSVQMLQDLVGPNAAKLKFYERPISASVDTARLRVLSMDGMPLTVMLYDNLNCSKTGASGLLGAPGMKIGESLKRDDIPDYISVHGNTEKMVSSSSAEHSYIERVIPAGKPVIVQFLRRATDKVKEERDSLTFSMCAYGLKFTPRHGKQYQMEVGIVQDSSGLHCAASVSQFVATSVKYQLIPEPTDVLQQDCQPFQAAPTRR